MTTTTTTTTLQILNEFASQSEHLKSIPPPVFLDIHRNSKQKEVTIPVISCSYLLWSLNQRL